MQKQQDKKNQNKQKSQEQSIETVFQEGTTLLNESREKVKEMQSPLDQFKVHEDQTDKSPINKQNGLHLFSQRNIRKSQTLVNNTENGVNNGIINSNPSIKVIPLPEKATPKSKTQGIVEADEELYTLLNQDQMNQKSEQNSQEEDKKVLIIYAGGFFGAEYENSSSLKLTKNFLYNKMKKISYFCDINFTYQHATEGFLVTPLSEYKKRVYYKVIELENLKINSTFFNRRYIEELLTTIDSNYDFYDSFIIIHGTDSMAYTASFVSFMIQNLSKPIIFTGSMVPLSIMRNDSFNNLLGALTIAGHFNIPEVCIFFHNKLLRANRATKIDAQGLDCFISPNFPELAELKVHIEVQWSEILKFDEFEFVRITKQLTDDKIEIMRYNPCFSEESLAHLLKTPGIKGVIIEGYGPGNLPFYDENFTKICQEAAENGIYIITISQSIKSYTSQFNFEQQDIMGIVYGGNMTTEATLAKLSYLLTRDLSYSEIANLMSQNLRGELTPHTNDQKFEVRQENLIEAITEKFNNKANCRQSQIDLIKSYIVPSVASYMAQFGFMHYLYEMKVEKTNFNFKDYDKRTALHVAVREQKEEVCQFLINEQVDVNQVDYFGRSPLYEAILTKNKKIVYMLKQKGGQLFADKDELTNLLLESAKSGDIETLKLIYHSGLKSLNDYINIDDRNVGHIAAAEGQLEVIKFLKYTAHFDFSQRDIWERTPFDDAVEFQHLDVVSQLQNVVN